MNWITNFICCFILIESYSFRFFRKPASIYNYFISVSTPHYHPITYCPDVEFNIGVPNKPCLAMNADSFNDNSNSNMEETAILKVATMNILAPCYNKVDGIFESDNPNDYMERHRKICAKLLETDADIIFLQEFWSASTSLRNLYINELCQPEINELNKGFLHLCCIRPIVSV